MHKALEKINGYGALLRFITPILVSIVLYFLVQVHCDIKELGTHFTNHLSDHKNIETKLENRLTTVETILDILVREKK
jgi:hypothetical protein